VPEFFRAATRWGLPSGTISHSEIQDLVSIMDPADLRARLRVYDEDARTGVDYTTALERIGSFYRTQASQPALEAILRVILGEERTDRAHAIMVPLAFAALGRFSNPDSRKQILLETIDNHRVLPVLADLLRDLGKEHGWLERQGLPEEYRTLPPAQLQEVLDAALDDIRNQAEESMLLHRHLLYEYLYVWRDGMGNDDEPKAYLQKLLGDQEDSVKLLRALIGEENARRLEAGESSLDKLTVVSRLRPLWVFGLANEARARADELLADGISGEDRELIEWFVDAHESANRPIDGQ
jgi:hypothetical protein